jgi:hypothetical protein
MEAMAPVTGAAKAEARRGKEAKGLHAGNPELTRRMAVWGAMAATAAITAPDMAEAVEVAAVATPTILTMWGMVAMEWMGHPMAACPLPRITVETVATVEMVPSSLNTKEQRNGNVHLPKRKSGSMD